jgi:hypothetical protein
MGMTYFAKGARNMPVSCSVGCFVLFKDYEKGVGCLKISPG